ncbi:hypothetical protein D9613_006573 [Agrocybe pediades]|uniref:Uncharacterized protein n=1 Tax=Agrocybe pediades TaxID=84607 RepID=A0A8H4QGK9_9AGAR|nr:hypothetical protein D9613_006573 [Agrocybe pediades]KAF9564895.1 hypothetical protein CPC08DRAFT_704955 [Agrocybe pediades]
MKISTAFLVASFAFFSRAMAAPKPQETGTVMRCDGDDGESCPTGFRCCGPISITLGGFCVSDTVRICPF